MSQSPPPALTMGKISPHLVIDDHVLRTIVDDDGDETSVEIVAQGHIRNTAGKSVDDVRIDVSYYALDGSFLGLDKTGFMDDDEIEPDGVIAFSIDLNIPEGTDRAVLNVGAKKMASGFLMRWLVGGKD